jgi:uncharacterized membrane protein HdeD (DUF308 family)
MFDQLITRWWIVAARGIVAVLFGLAALVAPGTTLALLVSLFGMIALTDGLFTIGAGLAANWLLLFLEGVFGGSIGLLTFFYPVVAQMFFVDLIMTWAFVTGGLTLVGAFRLSRNVNGPLVRGEWLLGVTGVISLAFGVLLAVRPTVGSVAFMWTVGSYSVVSGLLLLALALNIRTWPRLVPPAATV